jgi:parallel beta-helix repeat protein
MKKMIMKTIYFTLIAILIIVATNTFAQNYVVSGAGSTEVNGTYVENGTAFDKPKYEFYNSGEDVTYVLAYNGSRWVIGDEWMWEWDAHYRTNAEGDTPPSTGWEMYMMGMDPAPTVEIEGRSIAYSTSTFIENTANDGSIQTILTITHNQYGGDSFTGSNGDDFIAAGKVTVTNVPDGFTASIIRTSISTLTFKLNGNALVHANANDISNLTVTFANSAFDDENASEVSNYNKSNIEVEFIQKYTVASSDADYTTIATAVAAADDYDEILLAAETFTEYDLPLYKNITIIGQGAGLTIVQAHSEYNQATSNVMNVAQKKTVILKNITIRHGKYGFGAAIVNSGGFLYLYNCEISKNKGTSNWSPGGAISSNGYINAENCIFSDNDIPATLFGGYGGGCLWVFGTGIFKNCVFIGNSTTNAGGAIYVEYSSTCTILNCTFSGNSGPNGSDAIYNRGALNMKNCIVYNNGATTDIWNDGGTTNSWNSIIDNLAYINGTNSNNLTSDPLLQPLADNGGTIQSMAIAAGSPAINAGITGEDIPLTDMRGYSAIGTRDIGAFEYDGNGYTFTGAVSNNWNTAGNWVIESVPTAANDALIPAGKTAEIAPGTSASCNNITVDAAGSLTIQSSSATNAGSLIVAGTATGNVTFESYLAETGKWHVVAAPVAAQNIWDFATLAGNSIAANAGKRAVTEYVEGTNTWDTSYPTSDTEGSFSAGSGYTVLRSAAGLVAYTGTLNTSDVSKPLTRSLHGWNALGNPYTSAINATVSAHATNNLITANTDKFDPSFAALYLWDAATNTYVTINNTGTGSLVQNYIQAGQGFFVRAKDNTGLNFSITEAMQTHQTSTPLKSGETAWPTIQLAASGNGKLSKTVVTFNRNMTTGLDITYDAGMFKADKNFALYSRLVDDNGIDFAIQALPENYNKLVIPLGIDVPAGTEITFSAETMNLPADAAVYLEDRAAKTITQLDLTGGNYTVTVSDKTKGTGNFFLHTSAVTTVVNELENNLKVYTRDRAIYISGNLNSDDVIAVYGVDGKLHYRKNSEKTGLLRIDAAKMPAGVYLISIQQNAGRDTRKVVISE